MRDGEREHETGSEKEKMWETQGQENEEREKRNISLRYRFKIVKKIPTTEI